MFDLYEKIRSIGKKTSLRSILVALILFSFILNVWSLFYESKYSNRLTITEFKSKEKPVSKIGLIFPESPQMEQAWLKNINRSVYNLYPYPYASPQSHLPNRIPKNKGQEAMTYLTFIIDHYDDLPDTMFFIHGHDEAWHQDGSIESLLPKVEWAQVPNHYVNVRGCFGHEPGTPESSVDESLRSMWQKLNLTSLGFPLISELKNNKGSCCAQFIVKKEIVLKHKPNTYLQLRNWLLETDADNYVSGRVFEYFWHILFTGKTVENKLNCTNWLDNK